MPSKKTRRVLLTTDDPVAERPLNRLQRLSTAAELAWVLIPTVGFLIVVSFVRLWKQGGHGQIFITDRRLWTAVGEILVLGLPVAAFLRCRGWTWARMSEPVRAYDVLGGIGIWLYTALFYFGLRLALWLVFPHASETVLNLEVGGRFSFIPMAVAVVLDPIAEELLWLGYIVNALRARGLWLAAAVSIGLRTLVHAYQGPAALVGPLILGVLYTGYYLRTRRLAPVMLAHIIQDALVLSATLWSQHR